MTRRQHLLAVWGVPPILFSWEVILGPMPWTSLRDTIVVVVVGVAAIPVIVYLRQKRRLSNGAAYLTVLILNVALAVAMLYWKSMALLFFNGIIAVGYSMVVTSEIALGRLLLGVVASGAAVTAMNTTGVMRAGALLASCLAAVWVARTPLDRSKKLSSESSKSDRDT